jgi:probable HAF family extracellular repeat protein
MVDKVRVTWMLIREGQMKIQTTATWVAIAAVVVGFAAPAGMIGQEQKKNKEHHLYRLVDLGTLGGPTSTVNGGDGILFPASSILNDDGKVAAVGDTTIPNLFEGCPACFVYRAFFPSRSAPRNLGVLRENAPIGAQAACLDCPWSSWAYWLSEDGMVVGVSENNETDPLTGAPVLLAVAWRAGKIFSLGTLGGNQSAAAAANSRGDVVGAALNSTIEPFPDRWPYFGFLYLGNGTQSHAFLWRDGKMRDLKTLGGPSSIASFVNEDGLVAGASDVDYETHATIENPGGGSTIHPFLWHDGMMRDLIADAPAGMFGGTYGTVTWLNNRGQVTGTMNLSGDRTWRSYLWDRGVVRDLGTLGGTQTTSSWLSDTGAVVGKSDVTEICTSCPPDNQKQLHHPFLWQHGVMTDLGLLKGDNAGAAFSINRRGQIVGRSEVCTEVELDDGCRSNAYHAFLWEDGSMVDLQTLVLPGADLTVDGANQINDSGEIEGTGVLPNGDRHALLLIPQDRDGRDVQDLGGNGTIGQAPRNSLATESLTAKKTLQAARGRGRVGTNIPRP